MRKLLLALGLALTALAVRSSKDDGTGDQAADGVIDLTDTTGSSSPVAHPAAARATAAPPTAAQRSAGTSSGTDGAGRGHEADRPTAIPRAGWKDIATRTLAEVKADRVPMMAAAVAFAGFLAIFPAMIAAISIYGLVVDPETAAQQASDLANNLPREAASIIGDQLRSIADSEPTTLGTTLIISVLGALWTASGGMGMLLNALNIAYDEEDERGFVKKRGLAILLTLGAILFLGLTIGLIAVVPPLLDNLGLGIAGTIAAQAARWLLLAALIAVALAILYRYGPDREHAEWAWISPGAVIAGALWLLGSLGFSFFVTNFGSYGETYGAVAGVIVLMLWLQISALIVLLGAEMNSEMERQTTHDTTTGPAEPIGQRGANPADDLPPLEGEDRTDDEPAAAARTG